MDSGGELETAAVWLLDVEFVEEPVWETEVDEELVVEFV